MTVETLERAIASTKRVLANMSPDQLDQTTPCQSWKVRDLINHFVGGTYADGAAHAVGAFNASGVTEKTMKLPFGPAVEIATDAPAADRLAAFMGPPAIAFFSDPPRHSRGRSQKNGQGAGRCQRVISVRPPPSTS